MYIIPLIMNAKGKYGSPIITIKCFLINLIKMLSQLWNAKTIQYKIILEHCYL